MIDKLMNLGLIIIANKKPIILMPLKTNDKLEFNAFKSKDRSHKST